MDYSYFQGWGLDGLVMEERNLYNSTSPFGSFQQSAYNPPPCPPMSWSTTDPSILQMNENAWMNRVKILSPPAGSFGVETGGCFTQQRPNIVTQNSPFNSPADKMVATIFSDASSVGGDAAAHAQWMQMCSLSSDDFLNDAMPQLISDSTAQRPCMYTSSSDCLHEADSSGSSERDRPLSSSCRLVGSSSDEINWRNSDVLQGNLCASSVGFHLDGLPDVTSSSVAADLDTLDSSSHCLSSLSSMPGPGIEAVPMGSVSWMSPSTIASSNDLMVTNAVSDHVPSLYSFGVSLNNRTDDAQPYKRQRASCTLGTFPSGPFSQPLTPSLSKPISTSSLGSEYPMTIVHITDASLYKDFHVPTRRAVSLPKSAIYEAVGGSAAAKRDQLDGDLRSHRKPNATSIEPQSVAARHRRKKISERVRVLEKLIPGGNKMDTASMLDESIEYVKFLQLQVQLLESLGDMSEDSSLPSSSPTVYRQSMGGGKDGLQTTGSFGPHESQSYKTMRQVRPTASPLILSEILQQQLFKQKLCLVSLRQCPPPIHARHLGLQRDRV